MSVDEALLAFLERESEGQMGRDSALSLLTTVVRGPDAVRTAVRDGKLVAAAIFIDTCDNDANAAELLLFAVRSPSPRAEIESLLGWAETEASRGTRSALDVPVPSPDRLPPAWLTSRGYREAYGLHLMVRERGETLVPAAPLPEGFYWTDYDEAFFDSYYEAVRLAFREIPGANVPGREAFRKRAGSFAIAPRLLLDGKKVAGFVRVEARPSGEGELVTLGRHPDYRGKGLGEHLLTEGMKVLSNRGVSRFQLEVAARNDRALGLYRRAGFSVIRSLATYRWDVLGDVLGDVPGRRRT